MAGGNPPKRVEMEYCFDRLAGKKLAQAYGLLVPEVLEGDAWEIFESSVPESEAKDYVDNHWNDIKAVGYMMDIYNYRGGEEEISNKVLDDIFQNDDFEDIKEAIVFSVSDAQTNAMESEAYNHMKKEVLDHYEMGEPDWDNMSYQH